MKLESWPLIVPYTDAMECNLDPSGRSMRLYFGSFAMLIGLFLVAITYLNIIEPWGWIASSILLVAGFGSLLAASYGVCMLRSVLGR